MWRAKDVEADFTQREVTFTQWEAKIIQQEASKHDDEEIEDETVSNSAHLGVVVACLDRV